jgi:predicted acyl esterase
MAATDIGGDGRYRYRSRAARARIHGVIVDTSRRLQSVYVPVGDGVRLAVDVWLPVERTAVGGTVGTVMRVTRYYRAEAPQEPRPEADTNAAAGDLLKEVRLFR